jgi:hypothetical protein
MTVRIATQSDEAALVELLLFLHQHEPPIDFKVNEAKVREKVERGCRAGGGIIGIIDAPDKSIAATASLYFSQMWWSDDFFLEEAWIYVAPDHRSPEKAHWEALVAWVQDVKSKIALPVVLGVNARERAEAKVKMYASRFEMVGAMFVLR